MRCFKNFYCLRSRLADKNLKSHAHRTSQAKEQRKLTMGQKSVGRSRDICLYHFRSLLSPPPALHSLPYGTLLILSLLHGIPFSGLGMFFLPLKWGMDVYLIWSITSTKQILNPQRYSRILDPVAGVWPRLGPAAVMWLLLASQFIAKNIDST